MFVNIQQHFLLYFTPSLILCRGFFIQSMFLFSLYRLAGRECHTVALAARTAHFNAIDTKGFPHPVRKRIVQYQLPFGSKIRTSGTSSRTVSLFRFSLRPVPFMLVSACSRLI